MRGAVHDGRAVFVAVGQAVAARARIDSRRAHRSRADLETRVGGRHRIVCESGETTVGATPTINSMKIALIGHGAMGQLVEAGARKAGDEIGAVLTSKDGHLKAEELAEKLRG